MRCCYVLPNVHSLCLSLALSRSLLLYVWSVLSLSLARSLARARALSLSLRALLANLHIFLFRTNVMLLTVFVFGHVANVVENENSTFRGFFRRKSRFSTRCS